ncbi:MAG: pantothenate kinase [Flavobacteriales bacterium]|nr:pantothenate kinase [Flavobacteriales bacterium]|tara:strand:- start:33940 stop:34662 length:723 start_codon:yes stop_codon:yes gene_type:complete
MNLVLDIGNTNAKLAIFQSNQIVKSEMTNNLSENYLKKIINKYPIKNICCSNSGEPLHWVKDFCIKSNLYYLKVNSQCNLPINIDYESPDSLGSDRIALCVGAHAQYPGNNLIIDMGTCITFDIVVNDTYLGGQISPGFAIRLLSLHNHTYHLPKIKPEVLKKKMGKNTKESMMVGIHDSIIFEIEGVIEKYKLRYPNMSVILTGGDLKFVKKTLKNINFINPYLLMEGLNYIIAFNNEI